LPTVCPRCGTEGCPAPVFDVRGLQGVYADIACSLRLMARIQEAGLAGQEPPHSRQSKGEDGDEREIPCVPD